MVVQLSLRRICAKTFLKGPQTMLNLSLSSTRATLQNPKPFSTSISKNPQNSSQCISKINFTNPTERKSLLKCQYSGEQQLLQETRRVFIAHSIYKGKAALSVQPRPPEFTPLDSGAFKLTKEGAVLLQFAPAAGVRQYDWNRKQVFSLSVTEIGSLISLGARESCEFFHDPFKGRSDEGRVRKVLKVEPFPDGSGFFFNLSVQNKLVNVDENINIPISKGEFAVLISAFNFAVPYLLGWHTFANSIRPEDTSRANNSADLEWSR